MCFVKSLLEHLQYLVAVRRGTDDESSYQWEDAEMPEVPLHTARQPGCDPNVCLPEQVKGRQPVCS
jgi:hypothetical protein